MAYSFLLSDKLNLIKSSEISSWENISAWDFSKPRSSKRMTALQEELVMNIKVNKRCVMERLQALESDSWVQPGLR